MTTGKRAERIAAEYLTGRGFRIIEKNYRAGHKELDLIMTGEDDKRLHIVEVRSLREPICRMPYESVDKKKIRLIISAARDYIRLKKIDREIQFDIVSVIFRPEGTEVQYIPEAFHI